MGMAAPNNRFDRSAQSKVRMIHSVRPARPVNRSVRPLRLVIEEDIFRLSLFEGARLLYKWKLSDVC